LEVIRQSPGGKKEEATGCCHRTVGDERSVRVSRGGCGWNELLQEARGSEAQAGRVQAGRAWRP